MEIEERLIQHAIADAAIIGVPHAELGEKFKAVVQVEAGHSGKLPKDVLPGDGVTSFEELV